MKAGNSWLWVPSYFSLQLPPFLVLTFFQLITENTSLDGKVCKLKVQTHKVWPCPVPTYPPIVDTKTVINSLQSPKLAPFNFSNFIINCQKTNALSSWHSLHSHHPHNLTSSPTHYIYPPTLLSSPPIHQTTIHLLFLKQHKQMASLTSSCLLFTLFLTISILQLSSARRLTGSDTQLQFQYHKGPLLTGKISVNLIWYGNFKPSQKAIITDFITSLSSPKPVTAQPSVATWWKATEKYYKSSSPKLALSLGSQIVDQNYSLGKSLTTNQILKLAAKGPQANAINVVLTSADVAVEGFCSSRCGTHGSSVGARVNGKRSKFAYIWVGNSETQCPGQCAWPFHQPIYGPQNPPLVAPNNDVGLDGMIINVASLLAGTATNPFGNGYFQGPKEAPLEAGSACTGVYGKGAYPGYAGNLLVDPTTGASYNANGVNGRKYLLPALVDPKTSACSTLV
ncbi:unnamed protein product [Sphenostylis stenocarpa]|uniref:Uncharacterized protein n=1 Tax=Sphenostylis stenocarpa TaxID=92480 RepID=A0AA86TDG6_9FABA|nr:unnamed protein product [Sphenostylis stenocarpa]